MAREICPTCEGTGLIPFGGDLCVYIHCTHCGGCGYFDDEEDEEDED